MLPTSELRPPLRVFIRPEYGDFIVAILAIKEVIDAADVTR
jgi:hypothetical protein